MGYQVNFFAKFHNSDIEFIILTTDSFSIWSVNNCDKSFLNKDKIFEKKYNIKIIRNKAKFDRLHKNNLWISKLINSIYAIDPDIIFIHGIETFTSIRILFNRRILKKYFVVTDTHTLLNQFNNSFKFKIYLLFIKYIIAKIINKKNLPVFYTTSENKEILANIYCIHSYLIFPSLIGTDFKKYIYDSSERINIRNFYNISHYDLVILYVGKHNIFKQPHLILESFKILEKIINRKIYLMFIGSCDINYINDYFNIDFNNTLIKKIIITEKNNSELYKFFSSADFIIFPRENSLSSLDAQACNLPVIMEEDQTNAERLRKGGILYKKGNILDLSRKIWKLINDIKLRKKLAVEGYEYIKQNFDYSVIVENLEKTIEKLYKEKITLLSD